MALTDYSETLEVVFARNIDLGEGPIWDDADNSLVFVESNNGRIYRLDPGSGRIRQMDVGCTIGVAIPRVHGGFVVTSVNGLLGADEHSGQVDLLLPIEKELRNNRMNDGKCDSRGRLWSGTFSSTFERGAGSLYRIDPDLTLTKAVEGIRVSNGIAWSPDDSLMYFNDTLSFGIDVFDYDVEKGLVHNRRRFTDIDRDAGLPDGMAVDSEGYIWVSLFNGGQVRRYRPDGAWAGVVSLPVGRVTSCNFGGSNLDELYITTADFKLHDDGKPHEPQAGFVFRCRPGVRGLPSHKFAG